MTLESPYALFMTMVLLFEDVDSVIFVPAAMVLNLKSTPDFESKILSPVPRVEPVLASPPPVPQAEPVIQTRPEEVDSRHPVVVVARLILFMKRLSHFAVLVPKFSVESIGRIDR